MSGTQIWDDGSTMTTDAGGNVLYYTDTAGTVYQPDRSIQNEFLSVVLGGVRQALNQAFAPRVTQQAALPLGSGFNAAQLVPLALMAAAGFALFKLVK